MGICSSCLGGRTSESDQSDTSHLLGDQYQPNYGTSSSAHNVPQPDPEELRRQRENLERICAETNEQLIPVSQPSALPKSPNSRPRTTNTPIFSMNASSRSAEMDVLPRLATTMTTRLAGSRTLWAARERRSWTRLSRLGAS
ncbi:hypothetical protein P3342_012255 [Pyrenophora teres f. teres]|nr:hypothetical protein P3342_012255 [Pyrenophora teres f. teres]